LENGGNLEFKDIRYVLRTDVLLTQKQILHGITASIPKGSMVAIMGASGSGKTTLLVMKNMKI
jgi:ABC-type lipoprotein export system ATPase subunit